MTAQNPGAAGAHASHDQLLVARFAAGDALAADESVAVRAQLEACADCGGLADDLRAVQRAMAGSLAPRRPRDFRISTDQAESLRPGAWQRLLGRLSAPRMALLRPFAGATLAIGLVFVGASAVVPRGDQVLVREAGPSVAAATFATDDGRADVSPDTRPAPDGRQAGPQAEVFSDPAGTGHGAPVASTAAPRMMLAGGSPAPEDGITAFGAPAAASPAAVAQDQADTRANKTPDASLAGEDAPAPVLLLLGVLLAAISGVLLLLIWVARRAVDPLLR